MPLVSVIIPTFNRARLVKRAISSVLYQDFKDYEIIVVDDGSQDETSSVLDRFSRYIKIIRHKKNMGVSSSRNSGIRASSSPFLSFLDSDDYWFSKKLKIQTEYMLEHPDCKICQCEEIWIRGGRRVNPKNIHKKEGGYIFERSLRLCLISPSAVIIRRELFDEVGLFDEELPACEDYDMWLRISSKYPVHLIKRYLLVREGGRQDQLSYRIKGLDRFRIRSMVKLLKEGNLDKRQITALLRELRRKCDIYGTGCIKRGKIEEGNFYLSLPQVLEWHLISSGLIQDHHIQPTSKGFLDQEDMKDPARINFYPILS
mgnify:CR=1 FL=1